MNKSIQDQLNSIIRDPNSDADSKPFTNGEDFSQEKISDNIASFFEASQRTPKPEDTEVDQQLEEFKDK